jgi:hypothetical protein
MLRGRRLSVGRRGAADGGDLGVADAGPALETQRPRQMWPGVVGPDEHLTRHTASQAVVDKLPAHPTEPRPRPSPGQNPPARPCRRQGRVAPDPEGVDGGAAGNTIAAGRQGLPQGPRRPERRGAYASRPPPDTPHPADLTARANTRNPASAATLSSGVLQGSLAAGQNRVVVFSDCCSSRPRRMRSSGPGRTHREPAGLKDRRLRLRSSRPTPSVAG